MFVPGMYSDKVADKLASCVRLLEIVTLFSALTAMQRLRID
jgi:hypothetical protein